MDDESKMFGTLLMSEELCLTHSTICGLKEAVEYCREILNNPESDPDERRFAINQLKDLTGKINEVRSCKDHALMNDEMRIEVENISLELTKLEVEQKEGKHNRFKDYVVNGVQFVGGCVAGIFGYLAMKSGIKEVKGVEQEKFIGTEAEKTAVRNALNPFETTNKFKNLFRK